MNTKSYKNMNEMNNSSFIMVSTDNLKELFNEVKSLRCELSAIKVTPSNHIYTNKEIKNLLGVQDKLLKKYRDNGLLSYRQVGDKYWYTQADIDQFLASNYFAAFNVA